MSIAVINEVLDSSRSKGTARLLMVVLAEQAHEDGLTWPGIPRLARRMNTSERNVQLLMRDLESMGELIVETSRGRGNTNEYRVLPPATISRVIEDLSARLEKVKDPAEKVKVSALLEKVKSSAEKVKVSALLEKVKSSAEKVKVSAEKVKPSAEKVKHVSPKPLEPKEEPKREPTAAAGTEENSSGLRSGEILEQEFTQQGGADRADAPHGADGVDALVVSGSAQSAANAKTETATSSENVPPGGAALAALTGALAGLKRPVADLIAEYPDRQGWLELAPARIRELLTEARLANGGRYRGALIDALDAEVRRLSAPPPPPCPQPQDDDIDMAALIDGAPLDGNRRRA